MIPAHTTRYVKIMQTYSLNLSSSVSKYPLQHINTWVRRITISTYTIVWSFTNTPKILNPILRGASPNASWWPVPQNSWPHSMGIPPQNLVWLLSKNVDPLTERLQNHFWIPTSCQSQTLSHSSNNGSKGIWEFSSRIYHSFPDLLEPEIKKKHRQKQISIKLLHVTISISELLQNFFHKNFVYYQSPFMKSQNSTCPTNLKLCYKIHIFFCYNHRNNIFCFGHMISFFALPSTFPPIFLLAVFSINSYVKYTGLYHWFPIFFFNHLNSIGHDS